VREGNTRRVAAEGVTARAHAGHALALIRPSPFSAPPPTRTGTHLASPLVISLSAAASAMSFKQCTRQAGAPA